MAENNNRSEPGEDSRVSIEVAYARPDDYRILTVDVKEGTSVLDAARQSGMESIFSEIDWDSVKLGIFGKAVIRPADQAVKEGDRIEIYRPLIADPKEVRKKRAETAKLKKEAAAS
ncbi:RnfH family protein [Endozoicomonas sp. 8E]|uniref:RnfH family protein n=1 Tax=Endozoicomonas sp. 8E TaxID=3035692 RepID=UPI0029390B77|nr:RnfH family protein [Endozoicomonas sp. 8E]WOG27192.1 RnfH family protein [Endozoicomonas sp. 8E]